MAAQETSSADTSPSSHALSSGPHVRASQRGAPSVTRVLGGSSHFPLPESTPQDCTSQTPQDISGVMDTSHGSLMDARRSREKAVDDPLAVPLARCPGHEHRYLQSAQQDSVIDKVSDCFGQAANSLAARLLSFRLVSSKVRRLDMPPTVATVAMVAVYSILAGSGLLEMLQPLQPMHLCTSAPIPSSPPSPGSPKLPPCHAGLDRASCSLQYFET
ncbi:hypothetical protein BDP55DRAFT_631594 [Colletotrichum godetiae]|uniref:Uncharacterized protein n=1 Tax=Colletotrichum godetiae TaxID=1209918 RepID=A0AAJ0AL40_9PEZI|nr:uncharacterized protein BDP55DRAFT_631594 [Colletotrichum godetiae]KAK1675889.1 hypothetical protein BDP55DRAFT_631594 [Colletotrichum godetiae]